MHAYLLGLKERFNSIKYLLVTFKFFADLSKHIEMEGVKDKHAVFQLITPILKIRHAPSEI